MLQGHQAGQVSIEHTERLDHNNSKEQFLYQQSQFKYDLNSNPYS
jgi:uncharacterized protein (DUF2461 family)